MESYTIRHGTEKRFEIFVKAGYRPIVCLTVSSLGETVGWGGTAVSRRLRARGDERDNGRRGLRRGRERDNPRRGLRRDGDDYSAGLLERSMSLYFSGKL